MGRAQSHGCLRVSLFVVPHECVSKNLALFYLKALLEFHDLAKVTRLVFLTCNGQIKWHACLYGSSWNCRIKDVGESAQSALFCSGVVDPGIQIQRNSVHGAVNQGPEN